MLLCSEYLEKNMSKNVRSGYDISNEKLNDQQENVRTPCDNENAVASVISKDTKQEEVFYPLMSIPVELLQ